MSFIKKNGPKSGGTSVCMAPWCGYRTANRIGDHHVCLRCGYKRKVPSIVIRKIAS